MEFNKYEIAYILENEKVGRKYILNYLLNNHCFDIDTALIERYESSLSSSGFYVVNYCQY